jgi:hypothetical protein
MGDHYLVINQLQITVIEKMQNFTKKISFKIKAQGSSSSIIYFPSMMKSREIKDLFDKS